jgi:hypothetical protein
MSKRPEFKFDGHKTICSVFYNGREFTAETTCLPQDLDMKSDKVGQEISLQKAQIKCYKFIKNCELKPQLKILKQLYEATRYGKDFNEHSLEARKLRKYIKMVEEDIEVIETLISLSQENLSDYISAKDEFYNKIRLNRRKVENN